MSAGKLIAAAIVVSGIAAGLGMLWLQLFAFYDSVEGDGYDRVEGEEIMLTTRAGEPVVLSVPEFRSIDANSSPIRYRACATLPSDFDATAYMPAPEATPLRAPFWFRCFDAAEIGADLETGAATALMGRTNAPYGVTEVVAVTAQGEARIWRQLNRCGAAVFAGEPTPEGCPPPPAQYDD